MVEKVFAGMITSTVVPGISFGSKTALRLKADNMSAWSNAPGQLAQLTRSPERTKQCHPGFVSPFQGFELFNSLTWGVAPGCSV